MSTQINTYVLFGVVLDYEKAHKAWQHDDPAYPDLYDVLEPFIDNAFKPETNPKDGLTVLYDGMCGKYIAVGHVIAKTENHGHFDTPISVIGDTTPAVRDFLKPLSDLIEQLNVPPDARRGALGWHVISHYR